MPDVRLLRAFPPPDMGGHVCGLWRKAMALPGRGADPLRLRAVPHRKTTLPG